VDGQGEVVEYDVTGSGRWETRFHIKESSIAGRGLFAARRFATGEHITVYMGNDIGQVGTTAGLAARARLVAIQRADHVMAIKGRYVDGRLAMTGAQYINTALGNDRLTNNALFSGTTGSIRVAPGKRIEVGQEILMPYGPDYWRDRRRDAERGERDRRVGGAIAFSLHEGRRVVFIEEVLVSTTVRGKKLSTGWRLLTMMLDEVGWEADEIHLIVRADNTHAIALYERAGFQTTEWCLYEPRQVPREQYMTVKVAEMAMRMISSEEVQQGISRGWEIESEDTLHRMREQDARWIMQMYITAHGASEHEWRQQHPGEARHIAMWHADASVDAGACDADSDKRGDALDFSTQRQKRTTRSDEAQQSNVRARARARTGEAGGSQGGSSNNTTSTERSDEQQQKRAMRGEETRQSNARAGSRARAGEAGGSQGGNSTNTTNDARSDKQQRKRTAPSDEAQQSNDRAGSRARTGEAGGSQGGSSTNTKNAARSDKQREDGAREAGGGKRRGEWQYDDEMATTGGKRAMRTGRGSAECEPGGTSAGVGTPYIARSKRAREDESDWRVEEATRGHKAKEKRE